MKRLALLCLFALACGSLFAGTTRKVPADHATIQDAVDNSVTGDIIALSKNATTDGVYYENVTVPNTITGLTFTGKVIWDGTPPGNPAVTGPCLTINGSPSTAGPYLISGIIFRNGTRGVIASSGAGNEVDNVTVTGCQGQFLKNSLAEVRGDNFLATKDTLLGCNAGFTITGDNATISGNKFTQCSGDGVSITGSGVSANEKALIEKNAFYLHDGGQLVNVNSDQTTAISTSAKICVGGIRITGDNCLVTATSFTHVTGGVRITDGGVGNNKAEKNKFSITSGDCLDIRGPNAIVTSNSVSTCTGTAIVTDDVSPDVLSNSIKTVDVGIDCTGTGDNALIDKNKIQTTFNGDGITISSGDNLTVTNNSIGDVNNGNGISLADNGTGGATVDKNTLKNIGDHGIDSSCDGTSSPVNITNCSVSFAGANDQHGFNITGDFTQMTGCKVSNADGDGFHINASNCTLTKCSATKCGIDGFDSGNGENLNTFVDCVASSCAAEGFDNSTSTNTTLTRGSYTKNRIDIAGNETNTGTITISPETKFVTGGELQVPQVD